MGILRGSGLLIDAELLVPRPLLHGFVQGTEASVRELLEPLYLVPPRL